MRLSLNAKEVNMLPELKYGKRWGMDKSFYFNSKLKEFLDLSDEESIGKLNMQVMRELREAREELSLCISKYGMLASVSLLVKDNSTFQYSVRINRSLKEQRNLAFVVESKCKKIRLDKEWAQSIHQYVYEPILERCHRLNEQNLPELIATSKLCLYDDYLKKQGKTLNEDIQENLGFYGEKGEDADKDYYDHIMETIKTYEESLSEAELNRLLEKYNAHREIAEVRKNRAIKEKAEAKAKRIADFDKDATIVLQNWATDEINREQQAPKPSTERFYKRVYQLLDDMKFTETVNKVSFKVIAVVHHNSSGRISKSAFRWLSRNETTNGWYCGGATLQNAYPFFDTYEPDVFQSAVKYCEENQLVFVTVDMEVLHRAVNEQDFTYDYYDSDNRIANKQLRMQSKITLKSMTPEERQNAVWIRFHESVTTIRCTKILQMVYAKYGSKDHMLNQKTTLNKVNSDFGELLLYYDDLQTLNIDAYNDVERIRSWQIRMATLRNRNDNLVRECIMVQCLDKTDWVTFIKSFVDINNVTNADLKNIAKRLHLVR